MLSCPKKKKNLKNLKMTKWYFVLKIIVPFIYVGKLWKLLLLCPSGNSRLIWFLFSYFCYVAYSSSIFALLNIPQDTWGPPFSLFSPDFSFIGYAHVIFKVFGGSLLLRHPMYLPFQSSLTYVLHFGQKKKKKSHLTIFCYFADFWHGIGVGWDH